MNIVENNIYCSWQIKWKKATLNWVKGIWEFPILLSNISVNLKLFSVVKLCLNILKSRYLQYCLNWIWRTLMKINLKVITVGILHGRIGGFYFLLFTYLYFLCFLQWTCSALVVLLYFRKHFKRLFKMWTI